MTVSVLNRIHSRSTLNPQAANHRHKIRRSCLSNSFATDIYDPFSSNLSVISIHRFMHAAICTFVVIRVICEIQFGWIVVNRFYGKSHDCRYKHQYIQFYPYLQDFICMCEGIKNRVGVNFCNDANDDGTLSI